MGDITRIPSILWVYYGIYGICLCLIGLAILVLRMNRLLQSHWTETIRNEIRDFASICLGGLGAAIAWTVISSVALLAPTFWAAYLHDTIAGIPIAMTAVAGFLWGQTRLLPEWKTSRKLR